MNEEIIDGLSPLQRRMVWIRNDLYVVALILLALCGLGSMLVVNPNSRAGLMSACIFATMVFIWVLWHGIHMRRSVVDYYILFLFSLVLFSGGQVPIFLLGLAEGQLLGGQFSTSTLQATVWLSAFSILALHIGVVGTIGEKNLNSNSDEFEVDPVLRRMGIGMFLLGIGPQLIMLWEALRITFTEGYLALYQYSGKVGAEGISQHLAHFAVPGLVYLFLSDPKNSKLRRVCLTGLLLIGIATVLTGSRAKGVMPLLAFGVLWHRNVRALPLRGVLLGAGLAAAGFAVIAQTRNASILTATSSKVAEIVLVKNPLVATATEMGGSMSTTAFTLDLIPHKYPFRWGRTYVVALSTIIPNLGSTQPHQAVAGLPHVWLIHEVDPETARSGGGLGFSSVGEAYLNFGFFGGILAMGALGMLMGVFIRWSEGRGDRARQAVEMLFFTFAFFLPRGSSFDVIRPFVWYAVLPYVAYRFAAR